MAAPVLLLWRNRVRGRFCHKELFFTPEVILLMERLDVFLIRLKGNIAPALCICQDCQQQLFYLITSTLLMRQSLCVSKAEKGSCRLKDCSVRNIRNIKKKSLQRLHKALLITECVAFDLHSLLPAFLIPTMKKKDIFSLKSFLCICYSWVSSFCSRRLNK